MKLDLERFLNIEIKNKIEACDLSIEKWEIVREWCKNKKVEEMNEELYVNRKANEEYCGLCRYYFSCSVCLSRIGNRCYDGAWQNIKTYIIDNLFQSDKFTNKRLDELIGLLIGDIEQLRELFLKEEENNE